MINLIKANSDTINMIRSSAAAIDVTSHFVDYNGTLTTPGNEGHAFSSAATADIVASPATGYTRNVQSIFINNKDASLACTVTVTITLNGTVYQARTQILQPGDTLVYTEATGFFPILNTNNNYLAKCLTADDTGGQAVNTVQPWFPTAGGVTVPGASTYQMDGFLAITHGTTSHSTGVSFGGTATLYDIEGYAKAHRSAAATLTATFAGIPFTAASNFTVDAAGTQAATYIQLNGIVRFNAPGTFIPQFTFSANPTGTITVKKGSYFILRALGDNNFGSNGTWA